MLRLLRLGALVQQMEIFVETLIRRTAIIVVNPSDTIHGVEVKIQDQRRTRSSRLRHQKDASTLHLVLHIERIFIKKLTGDW